ncbi:hypothetical protein Lfu02_10710 [Longispora fulva]|uniref:Uncharacterized protein n=1 Tax=Longispora fulva TaxID=619741 RepID=A0A8J7KJ36_9ACTN|nr:hypothetical protein [Longispora fulva]MBG6135066.1 hypothetical protein [Longispora fulva]GIG56699.1 hypothetical protein Lfu02_10710 [Longispora fulva]
MLGYDREGPEELSPGTVAALTELALAGHACHVPCEVLAGRCRTCAQPWPCEPRRGAVRWLFGTRGAAEEARQAAAAEDRRVTSAEDRRVTAEAARPRWDRRIPGRVSP